MERSTLTAWSLRIAGFIVGAGIVVALEFVLVMIAHNMGYRLVPRGLGWIALPIGVGVLVSQIAASMKAIDVDRIFGGSIIVKQCVAVAVGWQLVVFAYIFMADPFGGYISSREWPTIYKWMLMPPAVAVVLLLLYQWAFRKPPSRT
ncbi:hypothetical protein [Aminobacter carboxidus]|uniref:TRAP transporter small permease subunit n=1 Tax=Aminobacter carboxidus TaxID=376165 RepID=A0ABR9GK23_9HYPH|nr:hypothetical protein [Aminobacter carboxidus]MBE1203974.1 hypothetical protein [Aminobacter carboxidus]